MLKPTVQVHNENGILVAEFWDCLRLDPGPVQDLRAKFERARAFRGQPGAVTDLLGVGFAGSASLGNFVALHRIARPKNGRLIFCNADAQVFEVFRVLKLEPLFTFTADRASALAIAATADGAGAVDGVEGRPVPATPRPWRSRKPAGGTPVGGGGQRIDAQ